MAYGVKAYVIMALCSFLEGMVDGVVAYVVVAYAIISSRVWPMELRLM